MDPKRAKEVRQKMEDKKSEKKKKRAKGFVNTKRRRKNLKEWVQFQRQRFNYEDERKKRMQEREKIIKERCGPQSDISQMDKAEIIRTCKLYHNHVSRLEEDLYDIDYGVAFNNMKINQLRLELDEMRGRFIKPTLKKVRNTMHWS